MRKQSWNEPALLESWRRCAQSGLLPDGTRNLYPLDPAQTQERYERYRSQVDAFARCANICQAPADTAFMLVDEQGCLLKKTPSSEAV